MESKSWEISKPILFTISIIMIYLAFIYWRFLKHDFSAPEVSNAMQAALIGILVLLTAYYAYATNKQANIAQKQIEGVLWERLIRYVLKPWIKQLEDNKSRFKNLQFVFAIYRDDYRTELDDLLTIVRQIDENYEMHFLRKYPKEKRSMKTYKREVETFGENLKKFVEQFWSAELAIRVKGFLEKRTGGRERQVHEVLEWTVAKLLLTEDQFKKLNLANRYNLEIWEPFLKEVLESRLAPTEEKKSIYAESLRLSDRSAELRKELKSKEIQLQIEYGV